MKHKIIKFEELAKIASQHKLNGEKLVQCHGVFDLLHLGHIKHFEEAKKYGDILIVSITPDEYVNKGPGRPAFSTSHRLEALASIELVDYVVANHWPTAEEIIKLIKPDFYCKGPDYKNHLDDITGKISDEEKAVELIGGKIKYTNDITFSSSSLINKYGDLYSKEQEILIETIKQKNNYLDIESKISNLEDLKVLVIGETIIDQYVFCSTLR